MRSLAMTYFRIGTILSSALVCFTVLFEMGRSGTKPLWSPNVNCQIGKPLEKNFFRYLLFNQLYFGDELVKKKVVVIRHSSLTTAHNSTSVRLT